jgi:anti-anti-sigma factor
MTALPELTYHWETPSADVGLVALTGDLVHLNANELLDAVTDRLAAHPALRELHVDCSGLELCDSRGLSILLMLRRHTDAHGLGLRIVHRPDTLNRMLDITGTATYLTGTDGQARQRDRNEPSG